MRVEKTDISYNFHVAKVVAILAVIFGHYMQVVDHPLASMAWIPASVGLAFHAATRFLGRVIHSWS